METLSNLPKRKNSENSLELASFFTKRLSKSSVFYTVRSVKASWSSRQWYLNSILKPSYVFLSSNQMNLSFHCSLTSSFIVLVFVFVDGDFIVIWSIFSIVSVFVESLFYPILASLRRLSKWNICRR